MTVNDTFPNHDHDISVEDTEDDDDFDDDDYDDLYQTVDIAVPFVLAFLVVVVLCVAVAVAKIRKRRLRRQRNGQQSFPSISGGVPMNAAAYLNHEFQGNNNPVDTAGQMHRPSGVVYNNPPPLYTTPGTPIEQTPIAHYNPIPYTPMVEPPKYEDIFKQRNSSNQGSNEETVTEDTQDQRSSDSSSETSQSTDHRSIITDKHSNDRPTESVHQASHDNKAYSDDSGDNINKQEISSASTSPSHSQRQSHNNGEERQTEVQTSITTV